MEACASDIKPCRICVKQLKFMYTYIFTKWHNKNNHKFSKERKSDSIFIHPLPLKFNNRKTTTLRKCSINKNYLCQKKTR